HVRTVTLARKHQIRWPMANRGRTLSCQQRVKHNKHYKCNKCFFQTAVHMVGVHFTSSHIHIFASACAHLLYVNSHSQYEVFEYSRAVRHGAVPYGSQEDFKPQLPCATDRIAFKFSCCRDGTTACNALAIASAVAVAPHACAHATV
ncbi:unnamed protein product, partial [Ceratitis capitata]